LNTYLIGSRGRLGRAIARQYADTRIMALDRSAYSDWHKSDAVDRISRYFDRSGEGGTIFVASGILDPRAPRDELFDINYHLPRNLIQGAARLGIKVVTFGTVMESLFDLGNPYVQSKRQLGDYVDQVAGNATPALHLRIHTLYGEGEPSPFMFLGQMLAAISSGASFQMTAGRQLREYHHLADEARAIRQITECATVGVMSLSHGQPVTLKAIAVAVFEAFGIIQSLQIGALPEPLEENYGKIFEPTAILRTIKFRHAIQGIVEYMLACDASRIGRERIHP
jgi:nucleoside-diphosphate-sugar epimerase